MGKMSDNGSQVVNPSDLRDASRERLLSEIGLLQHQYSLTDAAQLDLQIVQLKRELADSEMRLLQARDYARGCAAELGEARAAFAFDQQVAKRQLNQARREITNLHASRTWKLGRLIMLPVRIARRVLKVG
jgi:predicted  nucleic acid-binding Zn-ribbon protein